jgi:hypothetical protein
MWPSRVRAARRCPVSTTPGICLTTHAISSLRSTRRPGLHYDMPGRATARSSRRRPALLALSRRGESGRVPRVSHRSCDGRAAALSHRHVTDRHLIALAIRVWRLPGHVRRSPRRFVTCRRCATSGAITHPWCASRQALRMSRAIRLRCDTGKPLLRPHRCISVMLALGRTRGWLENRCGILVVGGPSVRGGRDSGRCTPRRV